MKTSIASTKKIPRGEKEAPLVQTDTSRDLYFGDAEGSIDRNISLNNTAGFISLPISLLNGDNIWNKDFTIEFWAKRKEVTTSGVPSIFCVGQYSGSSLSSNGFCIYFAATSNASSGFFGIIVDATQNLFTTTASTFFPFETWVHVALTYNPISGEFYIYLDGEFKTSLSPTGNKDEPLVQMSFFKASANTLSPGAIELSEFRFWKIRRTEEEIKNNYKKTLGFDVKKMYFKISGKKQEELFSLGALDINNISIKKEDLWDRQVKGYCVIPCWTSISSTTTFAGFLGTELYTTKRKKLVGVYADDSVSQPLYLVIWDVLTQSRIYTEEIVNLNSIFQKINLKNPFIPEIGKRYRIGFWQAGGAYYSGTNLTTHENKIFYGIVVTDSIRNASTGASIDTYPNTAGGNFYGPYLVWRDA